MMRDYCDRSIIVSIFFLFFILAARQVVPAPCAASATRRVSIHAPTARRSNSMVVSTRSTPARKKSKSPAAKKATAKKKQQPAKKRAKSKTRGAAGKRGKSPAPKKSAKTPKKTKKASTPKKAKTPRAKTPKRSTTKKKKTPAKKTPVKGGATKLKGKENIGERSADTELFNAWNYTVEDTLRYYQVDVGSGLTDKEAEDRLQRFGPNELDKEERGHD